MMLRWRNAPLMRTKVGELDRAVKIAILSRENYIPTLQRYPFSTLELLRPASTRARHIARRLLLQPATRLAGPMAAASLASESVAD